MKVGAWENLPITLTELCLATTLRCGQSFRWKQHTDQTWLCTLRGRVLQLTQDEANLRYRAIWPAGKPLQQDDTRELVRHYLNLGPDLADLYREWSCADANFAKRAPKFTGIRILRQDAWEALVGFICSSNNNIIRISQMVDKLCIHYGTRLGEWEGREWFDFPTAHALAGRGVESKLRELGFGYRAKYLAQTATMIVEENEKGWLDGLRNPESPVFGSTASPAGEMKPEGRDGYRDAHEQLLTLQGVGPKVADCVCLMGLGWGEAVPIDTHVWQIAIRDYKFGKGKLSSLTKVMYDAVANHFRKLWGKEAGWAHSVLFAADLRVFKERTAVVKKEEEVVTKKEQIVVKEEDDPEATPLVVASESRINVSSKILSSPGVKQEEQKRVLEIDETTVSTLSDRVKRRRRK